MADDLAGEVWVAVARGLRGFSGDEAGFRGWLFTIARRRLIEHRRRAARRRTDPAPPEHFHRTLAPRSDPAGLVVERMASQAAVDALVAGLPPDQTEAVLLRVVAGLEVAEVARLMGRSRGSVRVLCHRALRRMAERLGEGVRVE